jgi:hypothetical protein
MYSNLAFDFGVGLIPIVGDLTDAWFKCNTRNNLLLERYLRERGATNPVAPPPPTKQSAARRWFGPGPHAPGSHPVSQSAAVETAVGPASTVPASNVNNGVNSNAPVPPVRNGGKAKLSGRGPGTDGGRGILQARERDLEAQIQSDNDAIHYSRG